jgi:hypothetical protein
MRYTTLVAGDTPIPTFLTSQQPTLVIASKEKDGFSETGKTSRFACTRPCPKRPANQCLIP